MLASPTKKFYARAYLRQKVYGKKNTIKIFMSEGLLYPMVFNNRNQKPQKENGKKSKLSSQFGGLVKKKKRVVNTCT